MSMHILYFTNINFIVIISYLYILCAVCDNFMILKDILDKNWEIWNNILINIEAFS